MLDWKKVFMAANVSLTIVNIGCVTTLKAKDNKLVEQCNQQTEKIESLEETISELKEDLNASNDEINRLNEVIETETNWTLPKVSLGVCSKNKTFKSYMDYKCITNKSSKQYKLIKDGVINVSEDGLLRNDKGSIAVALSSRYGSIGDELVLKFKDGKRVYVIKADEKQESQLVNNCYHPDGSIIEILVDTNKIDKHYHEAKIMGDFDYSDLFNGEIVDIEKVIKE